MISRRREGDPWQDSEIILRMISMWRFSDEARGEAFHPAVTCGDGGLRKSPGGITQRI